MDAERALQRIHELTPQLLITLPLLFCISYIVYQRFFSPFANIPGPFLASLTNWWNVRVAWSGKLNHVMIGLHEKYGDFVRVGPNEVSIADLGAIKQIYGAGSRFRKSEWYSVWQGHRKFDLFAGRDERIHGIQRRFVARAYALETLKDLEPYVDNAVETFMKGMSDLQDQVIDMSNWIQLFAFDVIGEVTFAKSFKFMENRKDDGTFGAITTAMSSGAWLGYVPWVFWLHDALQPYIGNHLAVNMRHTGIRDFALTETRERKDRGSDRKDILSKLFQTNQEKPEEFSLNDIVSMATTNVAAGSDTTAISIRSILYHLLKNPQYKQRLIDEIDALRQQGELNDPPTFTQANKMPYLQAVLFEGLRCHPAVGVNLPRVVPEGGAEICGHYFPAGSVVGVNAWVVHQNKSVYGQDADKFNPERWLKGDVSDMNRFFFSFGKGSRECLGRNLSWIEMSKLVPALFMRFEVELAEPEAQWTEQCQFFVAQKDFNVKVRARKDVGA